LYDRLSFDYIDDPAPPPLNEYLTPFAAMWKEHADKWVEKRAPKNHGEWANWDGLAVHEDYGRQGIGEKLYRHNIELLKSKGYKGAVTACTGAFSQKIAEKVGVQLFSRTIYAEYNHKGEFPLAKVAQPHVEFQLREILF